MFCKKAEKSTYDNIVCLVHYYNECLIYMATNLYIISENWEESRAIKIKYTCICYKNRTMKRPKNCVLAHICKYWG